MARRNISRRQFIRGLSAAAVGGPLLLSGFQPLESAVQKSRVILVRDRNVLDADGNPKADVVLAMLDKGAAALTGKSDALSAWKTLIKPQDLVGIKTNIWNFLPTTAQVENALKKRVLDAGVKEEAIGIADRGVLDHPVFQKATALINARPMRSHHWAGVGSLIKNYIQFVPDPSVHHPDSCADLATIWSLPIVKGKTRLNVLVMLTPQFHGVGPHSFNTEYVGKYYGLLLGTDPVAVDATGLRIIEAMRRRYFGDGRPLNPPAKHIRLADTRYHLGTADPARIDLVKIGYDTDALI